MANQERAEKIVKHIEKSTQVPLATLYEFVASQLDEVVKEQSAIAVRKAVFEAMSKAIDQQHRSEFYQNGFASAIEKAAAVVNDVLRSFQMAGKHSKVEWLQDVIDRIRALRAEEKR